MKTPAPCKRVVVYIPVDRGSPLTGGHSPLGMCLGTDPAMFLASFAGKTPIVLDEMIFMFLVVLSYDMMRKTKNNQIFVCGLAGNICHHFLCFTSFICTGSDEKCVGVGWMIYFIKDFYWSRKPICQGIEKYPVNS